MTKINYNAPWAPNARKTSGSYTGGPPKAVLHATITPSMTLPGYQNQANAPHQTILWDPTTKRIKPWQHYYYNQFAKALRNESGGVETNRDSALQWELAGYLTYGISAAPAGEFDILTAPNTYWEQVADQIGPVIVSWGIPKSNLIGAPRLSLNTWDNYSGLLTHAQVPENDHWDLPIPPYAISILVNKIWTPVGHPPSQPVLIAFPLPKSHFYGVNDHTDYSHSGYYSAVDRYNIKSIQLILKATTQSTLLVDGLFGANTRNAVISYQRKNGLTADGKVGINTWRKMGIKR